MSHDDGLSREQLLDELRAARAELEHWRQAAQASTAQREREKRPVPDDAPPRGTEFSLRLVLDHVPAMVGYWDCDLRNRFANQAYADWFGLEPATIPGRHIREVIGEDLYRINLPYIEAALRGEAQSFERVIPDPRGGPDRHSLAEYRPDIADGEVRGFYVMVTDISTIKARERALHESEARFRHIVEESPTGIAAFQTDGACVMVNKAVAHIIGTTPEAMLAQNFRELDSWRRSGLLDVALSVLDTGQSQTGTFCFTSSFGRCVDIEARLTTLLMNGQTHLLVLVNDISERTQMETELRRTAEWLRLAQEAAGVGAWEYDPITQRESWTPQQALLYGVEPGTALSHQDWLARIHADDRGVVEAEEAAALADHRSFKMEFRIVRPDGTVRWVHGRGGAAYDEQGQMTLVMGVDLDITDRKLAEVALSESEELKRKTLQALPAHIAVLDRQGRIIAVNKAWIDFAADNDAAGSPAVAVGVDYLAICRQATKMGDAYAIRAIEGIEAVLGGTLPQFTMEYPCDSPLETRWFFMTVVSLGTVATEGLVITHLNITERKQAENVLAERERLLRTITENSSDRIFVLDREHRLMFANPAGVELISKAGGQDLCMDDVVGKTALDFFGNNQATRLLEQFDEEVMSSGLATTKEELVETRTGTRVNMTVRAPLRDTAGQVIGLVGIARDITERKLGETARLAELERQRDTLVREVHHRIKNHLQGITGLLSNRIVEHPETAAELDDVIRQINTIATVYGLQSQQGGARIELCQLLRETAGIGVAPVECRLPPGGSERELAQAEVVPLALVINELLTNAAKHVTRPGRPVRITLMDDGGGARIQIRCGPSALPTGFDFAAGLGLGTGLDLVRHLLPPVGARLSFIQDGDEVMVELILEPSLFNREPL